MTTAGGKFLAWWEIYLDREGFEKAYRLFADLDQLPDFIGNVRGILGMDIPHLERRHVVAVDELGILSSVRRRRWFRVLCGRIYGFGLLEFIFGAHLGAAPSFIARNIQRIRPKGFRSLKRKYTRID